MKRRIAGIEHEYLLTRTPAFITSEQCNNFVSRFLSPLPYVVSYEEVARQHVLAYPSEEQYPEWVRVPDPYDRFSHRPEYATMLTNQARAYIDSSNAEYATQECDNVFDLIACEKAGERHFASALVLLREQMAQCGQPNAIRLFKNNRAYQMYLNALGESCSGYDIAENDIYDKKFRTHGTHENYLVDVVPHLPGLTKFFAPHLLSLSALVGGGCVEFDRRNSCFVFSRSQRLPWIDCIYCNSTQSGRGFMYFRPNESFSTGVHKRLHVLSGDATLAEPAMLLKYSTSLAMLEMLEDEAFYHEVMVPFADRFDWARDEEKNDQLTDVIRAVTVAGLDEPLPTRGYQWTLRSLATFFAELRKSYADSRGFTEDRMAGLRLEEELLTKIARDPQSDETLILSRYSDHAFMKQVIRRDMALYGYSYVSAPDAVLEFPAAGGASAHMSVSHRLRYLEAVCHEIDPGRSRFDKATASGYMHRVVSPELIGAMMTGAPKTTRANRRKMLADMLNEKGKLARCYWTSVATKEGFDTASMDDPFISEPTEMDLRTLRLA